LQPPPAACAPHLAAGAGWLRLSEQAGCTTAARDGASACPCFICIWELHVAAAMAPVHQVQAAKLPLAADRGPRRAEAGPAGLRMLGRQRTLKQHQQAPPIAASTAPPGALSSV